MLVKGMAFNDGIFTKITKVPLHVFKLAEIEFLSKVDWRVLHT